MSTKEQYWKYSLITIIIGLGIILARQITPFLGGLLGALTIYILVRRQMIYLSEKRKIKRSIAATVITAEAILCFLVPLALVVWLAVVNLQNINLDPQAVIAPFEEAASHYQGQNRIQYTKRKQPFILHFISSTHRTDINGRHQQLHRQYVCTGICPLLHADRRKENGAICQRTSSFQ